MHRCEHRHIAFISKHPEIISYCGDGTDQCWVNATKNFGSEKEPEYYCILHAPDLRQPINAKDWPFEQRGEQQAAFLLDLLNQWNEANAKLLENKMGRTSFFMPGLKCGAFICPDNYEFSGRINLEDAQFSSNAIFNGAKFVGDANFTNAKFAKSSSFSCSTFSYCAIFRHTKFIGHSDFSNTKFAKNIPECTAFEKQDPSRTVYGRCDFSHAEFYGIASFYATEFFGEISFYYTQFYNNATFRNAKFGLKTYDKTLFEKTIFGGERTSFIEAEFFGETYFNNAKFSGDADFEYTKFYNSVDYADANFDGTLASFNNVEFYGETYFTKAKFNGDAIFPFTKFHGDASFKLVNFESRFIFNHACFQKEFLCWNWFLALPSQFTNCKIHRLSYKIHTGAHLTFNQCRVADAPDNNPSISHRGYWGFKDSDCSGLSFINMVDMSKLDFLGANVRNVIFESCVWEINPNSKYSKVCNHDKYLSSGYKDQCLLQALYQQLKLNLENDRGFIQSGHFHYQEMLIRKHLTPYHGSWGERSLLCLYHALGDFGENYIKLFQSMIFSILTTAYLVTLIEGLWGRYAFNDWKNIFYSLPQYFVSVFLALIPSPFQRDAFKPIAEQLYWASKFALVTEGLILLILTTLFVMSVRRHFKR